MASSLADSENSTTTVTDAAVRPIAVCETLNDLTNLIEVCKSCCAKKQNHLSHHCPLCPVQKFKPSRKAKVKQHLLVGHWKYRIFDDGLNALKCHLSHQDVEKGHFHCVHCWRTLRRRQDAIHHMRKCKSNTLAAQQAAAEFARNVDVYRNDDKTSDQVSRQSGPLCAGSGVNVGINNDLNSSSPARRRQVRKQCPICDKYLNKRFLIVHIRNHAKKNDDINVHRHHRAFIVHANRGIYAVGNNLKGPCYPIHVQKITGQNGMFVCESDTCKGKMETEHGDGNMSYECPHLMSVAYAEPGQVVLLRQDTLTCLVKSRSINHAMAVQALALQVSAQNRGVPFVVHLPTGTLAFPDKRFLFLSVDWPSDRSSSQLQRTVVTFDTCNKKISCRCCHKKEECPHKVICKWFLYQEKQHLLTRPKQEEEEDDDEEDCGFDDGEDAYIPPDETEKAAEQISAPPYPDIETEVPAPSQQTEIGSLLTEEDPSNGKSSTCNSPLKIHDDTAQKSKPKNAKTQKRAVDDNRIQQHKKQRTVNASNTMKDSSEPRETAVSSVQLHNSQPQSAPIVVSEEEMGVLLRQIGEYRTTQGRVKPAGTQMQVNAVDGTTPMEINNQLSERLRRIEEKQDAIMDMLQRFTERLAAAPTPGINCGNQSAL
ncbi:uncharacterized protein [Ptychodera flava]|uniref:uncharacterized protein isoform X3 n=1 Tax=Ptychodera flava TaxID=63121 RepID=UPI003969BD8D